MACQHNLKVTDARGEGCYVCAQNRSMIVAAFERVVPFVGRRVRVSGVGGERFDTILSVAWGREGADGAVVRYRNARGEIKSAVGFDIAFNWYGWHVEAAPKRRSARS